MGYRDGIGQDYWEAVETFQVMNANGSVDVVSVYRSKEVVSVYRSKESHAEK